MTRTLKVALLALAFLALAVASLCAGAVPISPLKILTGLEPLQKDILLLLRIPRSAAAALGGAALAASGALIQSALRNPLGSPNVIGVNSGAGFAAAAFGAFFPNHHAALPFAAFGGALCALGVVVAIGSASGAGRHAVVLAGVAVNVFFSAMSDALSVLAPDSIYAKMSFRLGSLNLVDTAVLLPAGICIAASLAAAFAMSRAIDALSLGDDIARNLGVNSGLARICALCLAALLAGSGVSFSGVAGFTGLIVPHVVKMLFGERMSLVLPASVLGGSSLVLLCDTISRCAFAPYEVPVGIMLSLLGAPFFVALLVRRGRK